MECSRHHHVQGESAQYEQRMSSLPRHGHSLQPGTARERLHPRRCPRLLPGVPDARTRRPQCQSAYRATLDCPFSRPSEGKASCSGATCEEGVERLRCWGLEGMPNAKVGHLPTRQAWRSHQRAWHRCAASTAEHERNKSCEGCWKTFCAPHLSLPKGLNLERGR